MFVTKGALLNLSTVKTIHHLNVGIYTSGSCFFQQQYCDVVPELAPLLRSLTTDHWPVSQFNQTLKRYNSSPDSALTCQHTGWVLISKLHHI